MDGSARSPYAFPGDIPHPSFPHDEGGDRAQGGGRDADYRPVVLVVRRPGVQRVPALQRTVPASASALLRVALVLCALALAPVATAQQKTPSTPSASAEDSFQKDTTPLPAEVTGSAGRQQQLPSDEEGASLSSGGTAGPIVRLIVGLGVVLAVVYGLYWLLRAHARGKGKLVVADDRLRVMAATPLGPGRALHLVKVGDELVLVGSAESAITPIKTWSAAEARRVEGALEMEAAIAPFRASGDARSPSARVLEELRRRTTRS